MYLSWAEKNVNDPSEISSQYDRGFVFVRLEKHHMQQTRSVRINMKDFSLNSENRRIVRKTELLECSPIPLPDPTYHWSVGKMAKDFYTEKFGDGTFSANKVKDLLTDRAKSNFNLELVYRIERTVIGYAICFENADLLHYAYPFYDLQVAEANPNIGMGMMIRAVQYAERTGKKYVYLGSAQRPGDTYKFQFRNMEWFDGEAWQTDIDRLKRILTDTD